MCCDTKRKIANSLLKVLSEKPLRKITVQDIMSVENMKRQSFYYHFQDIYGVVEWMFEEEFAKKLRYNPEVSFEQWVETMVGIIRVNRLFYRRVVEAVERERIIQVLYPVVQGQVENYLLKGNSTSPLLEQFVNRSICHFILDVIGSRKGLEQEDISTGVRFFMNLAEDEINDSTS